MTELERKIHNYFKDNEEGLLKAARKYPMEKNILQIPIFFQGVIGQCVYDKSKDMFTEIKYMGYMGYIYDDYEMRTIDIDINKTIKEL